MIFFYQYQLLQYLLMLLFLSLISKDSSISVFKSALSSSGFLASSDSTLLFSLPLFKYSKDSAISFSETLEFFQKLFSLYTQGLLSILIILLYHVYQSRVVLHFLLIPVLDCFTCLSIPSLHVWDHFRRVSFGKCVSLPAVFTLAFLFSFPLSSGT